MSTNERFGQLVNSVREAKDLSRSEVAASIGITDGMYYKLEKGQRKWTLEYIVKAAEALNARPWELMAALFDEEATVDIPEPRKLSPDVQKIVDTYNLLGPKQVILLLLDRLEKQ